MCIQVTVISLYKHDKVLLAVSICLAWNCLKTVANTDVLTSALFHFAIDTTLGPTAGCLPTNPQCAIKERLFEPQHVI